MLRLLSDECVFWTQCFLAAWSLRGAERWINLQPLLDQTCS